MRLAAPHQSMSLTLKGARQISLVIFFFNDTATTEIYTLSLHDALPIWRGWGIRRRAWPHRPRRRSPASPRSEEHTSELQSPNNLVCRLLLDKKTSNPVMQDVVGRRCLPGGGLAQSEDG